MSADIFKGLLSFEEARARLLEAAQALTEVSAVDTLGAAGRVLATGLSSSINVPPYDNAAMDGYAVRASDVPVRGKVLPVSQRIPAGSVGVALQGGTAARIFTGAPMPEGADAVVMQERCEHAPEGVQIDHIPRAGEHVRRAGEDIAKGSTVLEVGTRLTPAHLGLVASIGLAQIPVVRRMRVAVFFTGSELVMPGEPLPAGAIYNSNRFLLRPLLEGLGCEVMDLGLVSDGLEVTREALRKASEYNDLVLTSGGVSVGEEDHVRPAVEAEGRLEMWKVAIKPGKPLAMGQVGKATFIGLPGNPVAAWVTFLMLVRPFILKTQGCRDILPAALITPAAFDWPRPDARREFLRARINADGQAEIYRDQGSAVLSGAAWAQGLVDVLPNQVIQKGQLIRYLPYAELLG